VHIYNNYEVNPDPAHQPMYLDILVKFLRTKKVSTILDAGCGDGNFTDSLSDCGFIVYGFDLEPSGIRTAQARGKSKFILGDLYSNYQEFFGSDVKFDAVISIEVIEHLYDPKQFLYNCNKILPPQGLLVLTTPYWGYLKNILLSVFNRMDRLFSVHWDGGHIKHFSRKSLAVMVENYGFEEIYFKGAGRKIPFLWNGMLVGFRKVSELKSFERDYVH
jgi:2-polyprenyl-3-methyl-5-hydroxy-6-metoxy-1,4-benzoquinol methylase